MKDSLGNRIKNYENVSRYKLTPRMPVIIRLDGRSFHTFTKKFNRPFDSDLMDAMNYATKKVAEDMQGFKIAYIQSDEASFLITDFDSIEFQGWFDYNLSKMISISAATMTAHFNQYLQDIVLKKQNLFHQFNSWNFILNERPNLAVFDSRAFNIPKEDVANCFLWRSKDWSRNSLSMYARSFFSNKQLYGKNKNDMHEMLHQIGKNWTNDLSEREKNGTFILKDLSEKYDVLSNYESISNLVNPLLTISE